MGRGRERRGEEKREKENVISFPAIIKTKTQEADIRKLKV
jgi:hypothetical protein